MAVTPAASPSRPSNQFTVFIMPTIQNTVKSRITGQGKMTTSLVNGLFTRSMKMRKR